MLITMWKYEKRYPILRFNATEEYQRTNITSIGGNCTEHHATFYHFGGVLGTAISTFGIFMNILFIVLSRHSIGQAKAQKLVEHFMLAFSDFSVCASAIIFAVFNFWSDPCHPCTRRKQCFLEHVSAYFFWFFSFTVDQWVYNVASAMHVLQNHNSNRCSLKVGGKTERKVTELGLVACCCCLVVLFILGLARNVFISLDHEEGVATVKGLIVIYVLKTVYIVWNLHDFVLTSNYCFKIHVLVKLFL